MNVNAITILALDPSTDVTGAVVLYVPEKGEIRLIGYTAKDASKGEGLPRGTDLTARLARIRWTRQQIAGYLVRLREKMPTMAPPSIIAYETDTERGHAPTEALKMAAGAYLSLPCLEGACVVPVTRQAACIVAGCLSVYRQSRGKTAREQEAKRQRLKDAVREWAVREFPKLPADVDDAISDAAAVGMYAAFAWQREKMIERSAPVCRPLMGRGSRGGKVK